METSKYTYIATLRGGFEKSFNTFEEAFDYVLSISTIDFVTDCFNAVMRKGVFTREAVSAMLDSSKSVADELTEKTFDYLVVSYCTAKFKLLAENMWYLGHGWTLRKKALYE